MNRFFLGVAFCASVALVGCGGDSGGNVDVTPDTAQTRDASDAPQDVNEGTTTATMQSAKLNANTASDEQFRTIPGVGDKMVHEFQEYRPYASIQQFRKEIGKYVDEAQIAIYENYLFVPIDLNSSDRETLMQIPGLEPGEADQLIGARPFASDAAFFEKLGGFVSADELAIARTYVATR